MKRGISALLVAALGISLLGFNPMKAQAEELTLSSVSDVNVASLLKPKKTPDITSEELEKLKTTDPNRMMRVVVELSADSVAETAAKTGQQVKDLGKSRIASLEADILRGQNAVKEKLQKKIKFQDRLTGKKDAGRQLTIAVNAFSTFMRLGDLDLAEQTEGVAHVYIANEYYRPTLNTSVDMIDAPEAWSVYNMEGEGTVVAIIDSGIDPAHKDMRLDDLTVPAILPDYVKPEGLPGLYFTEKIPYGYNYYDLNTNIKDHGDSGHHGMHVAGTVAANGSDGGVTGVAPEAQLLAMKVFSDDILYATTFSDIYIKAMDDAVKLGADVVNMSLGSPAGFYVPDSIEDIAIDQARDSGVTVAISAGNERNMMNGGGQTNQAKNPDNGVVGSPSVNSGSLSVASVENTQTLANFMTYTIAVTSAKAMILPSSGSPLPWVVYAGKSMPLADLGFGGQADFTGKDLKGKIALIERGQNSFVDMLKWATAAEAAGVLVFNSVAGGETMVSMAGGDGAAIPHMFTGRTAGLAIKAALTAGTAVTVSFTDEEAFFGNPLGGKLSSFSSWGTPPDLALKPEISAPGGMIYSTQNDNGYTVMSGTSMAAPHVSGAAALAAQRVDTEFSNVSPAEKSNLVKTLLMNTAIPYKDSNGLFYDTRQQGAGLLNVANALETSVTVVDANTREPKVELFDFNTAYFDIALTLQNYDDVPKTFNTATILLTDDYVSDGAGHFVAAERTQTVKHTANAPKSVTVPAKGTKTIKFRVNFAQAFGSSPTNALTENQYLGGFIRFLSSDGKNSDLTVPVLGFYGDWDAPNVLDDLRWNLADNQASNDPEFPYTSLVNPGAAGLSFADSRSDIWINPTSESSFKDAYGTDQLALLGTLLRNAETITYRVKDAGGNTLRTVGQTGYARKIFRLGQGLPPYSFFEESIWDGTVAGRNFSEGEKVFYDIEILRTAASEPEVYSFPVRFDNLGPVVSNVVYDPAAQTLSLDITDAGSGVGGVDILSSDLSNSVSAVYEGSKRFVLDVSALRGETDTDVYILAYDNILNYTLGGVTLPGTGTPTPPPSTTTPTTTTPPVTQTRLDDAYGKPQIVLYTPDLLQVYKGPVRFKGVVYGWENISRATVTVGGKKKELMLTPHTKSPALDPEGSELFFGNIWTFDEELTLPDGYHEVPVTIYNGDAKNNATADLQSFNIVRRFWVDTTAPVIEASYLRTKGNTAVITLNVTDNLFYLEIYQADSLLSLNSWDDRGFDTRDISISHTIPVTLSKGTNVFTFRAEDAAGNETLHTVRIPWK